MRPNLSILACSASFAILIALHFIGYLVAEEILSTNITPSNRSAFVNESANLSEAFLNCASRCSQNKECIGITLFKYFEEKYSPAVNSYFCSTDLNVTSPQEIYDKNSSVVYKLMFRNKLKKVVRRPIVVLGRPRRQSLFPAEQMLKELIKIRNDSSVANSSIISATSTERNLLLDSDHSNSEDLPKQEEIAEQTSPQSQDNRQVGQNENEKANTTDTINLEADLGTVGTTVETGTLPSTADNDSQSISITDPPVLKNETEMHSTDKPTLETGNQVPAKDSGVSTEQTTTLASTVEIETSNKNTEQTNPPNPPTRIMNRTNPSEDDELEELIKELGSSTDNSITQSSTPQAPTSLTPLVVLSTEIQEETSTTPISAENHPISQVPLESNGGSTETTEEGTTVVDPATLPPTTSMVILLDMTVTPATPALISQVPADIPKGMVKDPDMEVTQSSPAAPPLNDVSSEIPDKITTPIPVEIPVTSEIPLQSPSPISEIPDKITTPIPVEIPVTSEIPLQSPSSIALPSGDSSTEMPEGTTSALELIITSLNSRVHVLANVTSTLIPPVEPSTLGLTLSPLSVTSEVTETNSTAEIPHVTTNAPENSEATIFKTDIPALPSTSSFDENKAFTPTSIPTIDGEIGKPASNEMLGKNDSQSESILTTAMPTNSSGLTEPTSATPFPFTININESDVFANVTDSIPTSLFPIPGPTTRYPILIAESDIFKTATDKTSTKSSGIIRPTPHYPKNKTKSYQYGTTDTKELFEIFDTDSKKCYFEDREMFRRNILAGTYAVLDGEPVLLTFVERSSCVATFSKNGHHGVFHMQNLLPGFPLQQVDAAAFIDDTLYLFDSFEGEDQSVHSFKFDSKLGIYEKTNPGVLTRSDFLARHCGMLLPANVTVKAFAKLSSSTRYNCIILDMTRVPIVSVAASHETKSLARAINYVLETEFVPYADAVFTWLDESLSTVYVFGSDGELYALTRDVSTADHWKYRVIPYSQFPV